MDGRDTDPKSGAGFIRQLEDVCKQNGAHVASIIGRFYAMDRDKRWARRPTTWCAQWKRAMPTA